MAIDLNDKKLDIETASKVALKDKKLCEELLENLWSKNETLRYNSSKILFSVTEVVEVVKLPVTKSKSNI